MIGRLKETTINELGRAKSVKGRKENTVMVDSCGNKQNVCKSCQIQHSD